METQNFTVTVDTAIDSDWIDFCCRYIDVFMTDHCGYWMRGMMRDRNNIENGWLVFEHGGGEVPNGSEPNEAEAIRAWKANETLPPGYFRLDGNAARRAWAEGVKRRGSDWYESADALDYDAVIQMALLGEIRYG